jgi:N-acetylmuramoyl-L-alanine amidase
MAFKIALTAGHYLGTPGKRCLKSLDPKETREWTLNDRIADKVEKLLQAYTGWQLIRTDDTTGAKDISLQARTNAANNFKADVYISIHHNAGINGGKGGGIMAYIHPQASTASAEWQKALYAELIAATGLKGNRSQPLAKSNLHEVRETTMPAVLLELGFMDSTVDVPVILTDDYARKCAAAIVDVIAERAELVRKPVEEEPGTLYRVQVGAFSSKANAEKLSKSLAAKGYQAYITRS